MADRGAGGGGEEEVLLSELQIRKMRLNQTFSLDTFRLRGMDYVMVLQFGDY